MLSGSSALAQVNLGLNPTLSSGSQTINGGDTFTGTYAISGSGTLYLASNFSLPSATTLAYSGTGGTYLSYTGGGPFTFTVPTTSSLTRSGGSGFTYVYDHVVNNGTVAVSGGTLQFQSGTTLTNASGATTTVSGAGSTLYLYGLVNAGTLTVDTNGVVQLAGATFTTANLGNISLASGGAVKLTGILTNTSANLTAPTGGAYTLLGGTIIGGTIASGAVAFTSSVGVLDGATITGDVAIGSGELVTFKNNAGFTGTATVNNGTFYLGSNFLAQANSAFVFTGANSYLSYVGGGPYTLTLPTTATLTRSGAGYTYVYDNIVNQGAITVSGGNLQFQTGATLTTANGSTTTVTGSGSTLYLTGLANAGSMTADNLGLIQLAGTFTTAGLGAAMHINTTGIIKLTGTLNNASATLSPPTGGAYTLAGGTVNGGTIDHNAFTFTNSGGVFDNATVNGNLTLNSNEVLTLRNGAGVDGTTTVDNATLYLASNLAALAGRTFNFTGANSYLSYTGGGPYTLSLPAGTALNRTGTGYTYVYDHLANSGTVTVSGGGNLQFQSGTTLSNTAGATTTVTGSGSTLQLYGLANAGTLTADNSGLIQLAGTFTTGGLGTVTLTNGGSVKLTGTLTNTSANLTAPSGGSYTLLGGTITGGTIANNALTFTSSGGYLTNAALTGDLTLPASAYVRLTGGSATFTGANLSLGSSSYLYWQQTATLAAKSLTFGANSSIYLNGVGSALTLDSASTASGNLYVYSDGSAGSAFTNAGTLTHTGGTGYLYAPTFTNSGTITANAGTLNFGTTSASYTTANSGTVTADGSSTTVYISGNVANTGTLRAQNSAKLIFNGTNTTANLGTVQLATGGHALLNGTLTNTSATLNTPAGGAYELYGGSINNGTIAAGALTFTSSGGTLAGATYTGDLTLPGNTSVTLAGGTTFTGPNLTLGANSTLNWYQNGTLTGKIITIGSGTSYGTLAVGSGNALTFAADTALTGVFNLYDTTSAMITNLGSITANSGTSYFYGPTVTNSGTVTASAGASLYFGYYSGETTTNATGGTVTATGTNAKIYLQNIVNQGTLQAQNNGILQFQGTTMTTVNLGTVALATGGRALLAGTLNNASATLNAPSGGTFELDGGTINNGTIAAGALTFTTSGGTLSGVNLLGSLSLPVNTSVALANVTLAGDITLADNAALTLSGNTLFPGANLTLGGNSTFNWNQNGTLSGKTITAGSGSSYARIRVGNNNTLTLGATTTLTGIFDAYANTGASLINQGTVNANTGTSYFYGATATNAGTITASAGATLYVGYNSGDTTTNAAGGTLTASGTNTRIYLQNIVNQGTLEAQNNGALYFQGTSNPTANLGTVALASGGHAYLNGTFDNTSATLTAPAGGAYELSGGTINNGSIATGALTFTSSGGTVNAATFLGDLNLTANSYVYFTGGTNLTGTNLTFANNSNLYWQQSGTLTGKTITLGTSSRIYVTSANRALTLGAGTTVTGNTSIYTDGNVGSSITNQGSITNTSTSTAYLYAPTFTNSGAITATAGDLYLGTTAAGSTFANASGATLTVNGGNVRLQAPVSTTIVNQGTINVQSGTLYTNNVLTNAAGGTLAGSGTINGNVVFTGGTLAPGNSAGTLQLLGNLTLSATTNTVMEIGATGADRVTGLSTLNLGGLLTIAPLSDVFTSGQTWNLFSATTITGSFASFNLPYTGAGWVWDTSQLATTGNLTLTTFVPVPEPSTYLLMAAGLALIVALHRRRK